MPRTPRPRTALAAAAVSVLAALAPASASAAATGPAVGLRGAAAPTTTSICGGARSVATIPQDGLARAVVRAGRTAAARRARLGSTLAVDRCVGGAWVRVSRTPLEARHVALLKTLPTAHAADLRIRTRTRAGRNGPATYARVGVGEVVDLPVAFTVVNQNRTQVPCLGAPDGRTYSVRGTLVAPRTALDSGRAVTLYLHGLGYSGDLFFRFRDVPGYDYGTQQAEAGHAGVYVTRLGNPTDPQVASGNDVCFSSQADMADQMIGQLRKGTYTLGGRGGAAFRKVGLAGHSAGGFITEITQYSFRSADAIAVISYTDTPSPLTFQQFLQSGQDCFTAPSHAGPGDAGPPDYAAFGKTDADFAGAHFFDVDPLVARKVLARHNRDPCGDLVNAAGALVADQPLIRTITSPVLIISGTNDALFPPPTNLLAAKTGFPQSPDVSLVELPQTGHAVTLGRSHLAFRAAMGTWLTREGL